MIPPDDRRYIGIRDEQAGPATVMVVEHPGVESRSLDPRNDLRDHSPDGFQWGYGGSGPAQLALALCADALGNDARAMRVYQDFKFAVIARITGNTWELSAGDVQREVADIEAARQKAHLAAK